MTVIYKCTAACYISTMNIRLFSLIGVGLGILLVIAAQVFANYTETSGTIVGANIGASLIGLAGFAVIIVSVILFITSKLSR